MTHMWGLEQGHETFYISHLKSNITATPLGGKPTFFHHFLLPALLLLSHTQPLLLPFPVTLPSLLLLHTLHISSTQKDRQGMPAYTCFLRSPKSSMKKLQEKAGRREVLCV